MFRPRVFVVLDPKNVEHVLKNNFANYGKGAKFRYRMQVRGRACVREKSTHTDI